MNIVPFPDRPVNSGKGGTEGRDLRGEADGTAYRGARLTPCPLRERPASVTTERNLAVGSPERAEGPAEGWGRQQWLP